MPTSSTPKLLPAAPTHLPIGKRARSLPALVAAHLTGEILSGAIAPGARLTEIALAEQHSVSRATVREALSIVEKARLVERIPRYGAQVVDMRVEEIQEISEIRGVLLGLAVQRAMGLAGADEVSEFRALVKNIIFLAKSDSVSPDEFAARAVEAQRKLLSMARSRSLSDTYEQLSNFSLWNSLVRSPSSSFLTPQRRLESARNWRRLADALEKKNAALGEVAARDMLADVARLAGKLLAPAA